MKKFTTRSEEIFFACCRDRGWVATKIEAPGNKRAPDFIVRAGDIIFVAEIKEFHPRADGKITGRHRPTQKLRKAINNARGQLKGHDCPTMLVLLDLTESNRTDSACINEALLGTNKKRHQPNMQISALGILQKNDKNCKLEIHINPDADIFWPNI